MKKLIFTFFLVLVSVSLNAQNCINKAETHTPWTNIPYLDGDDSHIKLEGAEINDWLDDDFTMDLWINCQWPVTNADNRYFFFSIGNWSDDHNSLYMYIEQYSGGWRIRLSDGQDDGSNVDLIYNIDYNQYVNKWKHLAITFDETYINNDRDEDLLTLYIDGNEVAQQECADLDLSASAVNPGHEHWAMLGELNNTRYDFRGYISGLRIWTKKMEQNEIDYIHKRSFHDQASSFHSDFQHLFSHMRYNMYTDPNGVHSLSNTDVTATIYGANKSTDFYHPARPVNAHNLTDTRNCESIRLDWDRLDQLYTHCYVYRRLEGETLWGDPLCITSDNYFIDTDDSLEPGQNYEYKVDVVWRNPNDPLNENSGYYVADPDNEMTITTSLKKYPQIQNFHIVEDASSGNCLGQVKLAWDATDPEPIEYYIQSKIGSQGFSTLVSGLTGTSYTHTLPDDDLAKDITYRIDGGGDACTNYSEEIIGKANKPCSTQPTNVTTTVDEKITVNWNFTQSGAPATAFRIYRSADGGDFEQIESEVPVDKRSYKDLTSKMCVDYRYKIEAFNTCGEALSTASDPGTISPVFDNVFTYKDDNWEEHKYFDASKGYFNQKVELEWEINPEKKADIEQIEIYRRKPGQSYSLLTSSENANTTNYTDQNTEANQIYEYMIRATGFCTSELISDSLETLGFRNSTGIVSGKITFEGGNAVEDAEVLVSTENPAPSSSLLFQNNKIIVPTPIETGDVFADDSLMYHPLCFEAWIKPDSSFSGMRKVIFMQDHTRLYLALVDMRPMVVLFDKNQYQSEFIPANPVATAASDTALQANSWYHIAFSLDNINGKLSLFLNGDQIAQSTFQAFTPWGTPDPDNSHIIILGSAPAGDNNEGPYSGYIDEVCLWQKARKESEIKRDYKRFLTGEEEGLIGYWRADENYGYHLYDISKTGEEFNKNHLVAPDDENGKYAPEWSSVIPSFEQLHPSGITDERGNYVVKGIRYAGNGGIFNVSPMLGVHEFDPTDVNIYISDNDPVHNNINFTDISAFRFTGKVKYRNTNFPVEGAEVYVDNKQVFDAGGNPIKTDANGEFEIQVPIGEHYVSVKKNKHVFVNNGQWPAPTENEPYPTHNFQDDVFNITFLDSTQVKLCGRFVGDDVEGNKKIGFGKSKANIGQGKIVLRNAQDYDITFNSSIQDTSVVSFYTDNESGEYEVWLLPEEYLIDTVGNAHYEMNPDDLGVLDLRSIPSITQIKDTTYTEEINGEDTTVVENVEEYEYHFKRNFIIYAEPEIIVHGRDNEPFMGEQEIIFTNPETENKDTLDLINDSPFKYPVFDMNKGYDINILVQSRYYNYDDNDTLIDIVSIKDAEVTIANNLEVNQPIHELLTDSNGHVSDYEWFNVGKPVLLKDETNAQSYTKTMTITAQYKHFNVQWEGNEGNLYRAYVLGAKYEGGANFVTYGPEIPEFILRDPPGSHSYTYLEKGSGYSTSNSYNFAFDSGTEYDNTMKYGWKFEMGGGLAGIVYEAKAKLSLNGGLESSRKMSKQGEIVESYQFNKRFQTSSDPAAVGSMADVYIGRSYNRFFTETSNLRVLPKSYCIDKGLEHLSDDELDTDNNDEYTLGIRSGFAVTDDSSATNFVYTQDHILNSLIPEYRELIFELLDNSSKYESRITADHPYYGTSNNAIVWEDTIAAGIDNPSYTFNGTSSEIDTLEFLNQQISIWIQTIAANEMAKINASELVENLSIDGNTGAYTNEVSYTSVDKNSTSYSYKFKLFGGKEVGMEVNGFGFETVNKSYVEWDRNLAFGQEEQKDMTFGYVIDDGDVSDYYSIDVKMDKEGAIIESSANLLSDESRENFSDFHNKVSKSSMYITGFSKLLPGSDVINFTKTIIIAGVYLNEMENYRVGIARDDVHYGLCGASPVFRIRGGKSSCPWEGAEHTMFYLNPDNNEPYEIHTGTQKREAPKINIEPQTIINVPDNQAAVFTLKLSNESMTGHDFIYRLKVDESANPNGAIIRVDGLGPNRGFFIPAGETLTKTLTVQKGASGVLDYENLQLILHSSCQYDPTDNFPDIADTVTFSAHFIPACTEVSFENLNDNWVANVGNRDTIPLTIKDYDLNQSSFEKIWLQYSQPGTNPVTKMIFYKDADDFASAPEPKTFINGEPEINYDFDISAFNDGNYNLIVKSGCYDGSTFSEGPVPGVIDRITPKPFGAPQPADGVLSPGDEIKLNFNEDINSGDLYAHKDYINVRGVVNGTDLKDNERLLHDASLHFDGQDDYMAVQHGINLDHTSFTIEFWAKRNRTGKECLVSLGSPLRGGLWIGFDENDHFMFSLGGKTVKSENAYTSDAWNHYSCVFDKGDNENPSTIILTVLADAQNDQPDPVATQVFTSLEDVLYAGYCPEDGTAFQGNMHEFRIWNTVRLRPEISADKSRLLNGYEQGLYGLWAMDDASGHFARDKAFGRNGVVNATWHVSRDGKALTFDGTSYAKASAGTMVFDNQANFTIEFWFKAQNSGSDMCLLSNGKGDGTLSIDSWTIMAKANNTIEVANNGETISFDADNYLNNNWQHFAMSVNRQGYLSLYINGKLVKTTSSSRFEGFGSSHMVLGAKWYTHAQLDYFENYFTGEIDEVRVWNSSRPQKLIQRYMNHALQCDEMGLQAYFPFEDVRIEDPSISNETLENLTMETIGIAGNMILFENADFTGVSPNIKLHKPEVSLPFDYVINEYELIVTPSMDAADIENTILNISVKRVKDLNNNRMASVVNWTAFVDKNQVIWDKQEMNVEKQLEDEIRITATIQNKSGLPENYQIKNIPDWMEVVPDNGSLNPLENQEVEITIKPSLNVGKYTRDLHLVSSMGYNERLLLNVTVKGQEPDWQVQADDYEYTASIIGQLSINDVLSTDTDDKVAAFINSQCRGVANVQYFETGNMYLVFMDVYDNQISGNDISFKVYDAGTGQIYTDVTPQLSFEKNKLFGSVNSPVPVEANISIEQQFDLHKGWNWLSFNVYSADFNDLNSALADFNAQPADAIKSQNAIAQLNSNYSWEGPLNRLNYKEMYKFKVAKDQQFAVSGARVISDTVGIELHAGWNWIGFPATKQVAVKEALSSLHPAESDILKSQQQFAVFDPTLGWIGSLTYLKPGNGYMLSVQNPETLVVPGKTTKSAFMEPLPLADIPSTANNMTVIARLNLENAEFYTLKAFADNELCGIAQAKQVGTQPPLFFITINSQNGKSVRFEADNGSSVLVADKTLEFVQDVHFGQISQPHVLNFTANFMEQVSGIEYFNAFPNPVYDELQVLLQLNSSKKLHFEMFNALGVKVFETKELNYTSGKHEIDLSQRIQTLSPGVYILKLQSENNEQHIRIVKQKR